MQTISDNQNTRVVKILPYEPIQGIIEELRSPLVDTIEVWTQPLTEHDEIRVELMKLAEKPNKVTKLTIHHVDGEGNNSFDNLLKIIKSFENVTLLTLKLYASEYNSNEIEELGRYIRSFTSVTHFQLMTKYQTMVRLSTSINCNETIKNVGICIFQYDYIETKNPILIIDNIKRIEFSNCIIDSVNMNIFNYFVEELIESNSTITELCFRNVSVDDDTMIVISEFAKTHPELSSLTLADCGICDNQLDILAKGLDKSCVEKLDPSTNKFSCDNIDSIERLLESNHSLKSIDMRSNSINYRRVIKILKVLAENTIMCRFVCTAECPGKKRKHVIKRFEKLLSNNCDLIDFFADFYLDSEYGYTECKHITNRNKERIDKSILYNCKS